MLEFVLEKFLGYHSEWNLGSPGGWDYQRINQEIGKSIWEKIVEKSDINLQLDFDHPCLNPVTAFVNMLKEAHAQREGSNTGFIAVVAEQETLEDVVENKNLVRHLNAEDGITSALMAPHEIELKNGKVCWQDKPITIIFMDFNTDVLLNLHRKFNLAPVLRAVREGRVINPRGTEPINSKSMFEVITDPRNKKYFHRETINRTPWTRQFYPRQTEGPEGENISDLIEWTRSNWANLVLKPERGYSGKGVRVGGIHSDVDNIIAQVLKEGNYIVQQKVPLDLWTEKIPELDQENAEIREIQCQTDFRCLFGKAGLFGFLGRYGGVPTNVGSGGGVQPLAVIGSQIGVGELTEQINNVILNLDYSEILEIFELQKKMALDHQFTYLLGPIKIALRPRLLKVGQIQALEKYCRFIWDDCLMLENMWFSGKLDVNIDIDPEELEIIQFQPWRGSPAIFASDGLFSFGAHIR
jgi:hypothetical protein